MKKQLDNKRTAWECKIGCMDGVEIPPGADAPMRKAVKRAFIEITGREPDVTFSGWGAEFTPTEQAVIRNDGSWPESRPTAPVVTEGLTRYDCALTPEGKTTMSSHPVAGSPAEAEPPAPYPHQPGSPYFDGADAFEAYQNAPEPAEPMPASEAAIYQIESALKDGLYWRDTNKQVYDEHFPEHRRIVYAAPAAPTDAKSVPGVIAQRTESIRQGHSGNERSIRSRTRLLADVEELLAHIALLTPSTAAQSVRDAAQPTAAPGKEGANE